jgi:hypothetical protein
MDITLSGNIDD